MTWAVLFHDAFEAELQRLPTAGADRRRFYKRLINIADARFDEHLAELNETLKERKHGKET